MDTAEEIVYVTGYGNSVTVKVALPLSLWWLMRIARCIICFDTYTVASIYFPDALVRNDGQIFRSFDVDILGTWIHDIA